MQTGGASTMTCAAAVFMTASKVSAPRLCIALVISRSGQRITFAVRIKVENDCFSLPEPSGEIGSYVFP